VSNDLSAGTLDRWIPARGGNPFIKLMSKGIRSARCDIKAEGAARVDSKIAEKASKRREGALITGPPSLKIFSSAFRQQH
jgi:hypothetical protein